MIKVGDIVKFRGISTYCKVLQVYFRGGVLVSLRVDTFPQSTGSFFVSAKTATVVNLAEAEPKLESFY